MVKVNQVYSDSEGNKYKITQVLLEGQFFVYKFKGKKDWFFRSRGAYNMFLIKSEIDKGNMWLDTPINRILYGKENNS